MIFRNVILTCCMIGICLHTYAQFGMSARYATNDFGYWSEVVEGINGGSLWDNNMELAIDYNFRRPLDQRVEFFIEGRYLSNSTALISPGGNESVYNFNGFGLGVNTNVYFLDFNGDCDCPTFGKEGGLLKKGLYLQFNAAASYWNKEATFLANTNDSSILIDVGVGIGLDIGISNLLTISPIATVNYYPIATWEGFALEQGILNRSNPNSNTSISMLKFGFRIGLHPDFIKERRVLNRRR